METKTCTVCGETKPLSDFGLIKGKPRHNCKSCKRIESREWYENNKDKKKQYSQSYRHIKKDQDLKKSYGISLETYNQMLVEQNYKCKICSVGQESLSRALCVDHCHTTGKIRGLLCDTCNRAIGLLKDNLDVLRSAITYLEGKDE